LNLKSVVAWTLTPTKGGTHVRMEQSGFRSEEDGNYKGASYGWQKFIGSLERVVGGGLTMKAKTMKKSITTNGESPSRLIDARIKELDDWRGKMLSRVRALIKQADPEVVEEWKWRGVPVWYHDGMICLARRTRAS
jgi:hypothetical protein